MNKLKITAFIWWGLGLFMAFATFYSPPPKNYELWVIGSMYLIGLIHYIFGMLVDELDRILNPPIINKIEIQEKVDKIA